MQLTRVLMSEPNVLLLDEPTNDLDIDTLQELESLLDNWAGTLVVISHDRYLIERIADSTWALFGDGKLTNLPGGIDDYLKRRHAIAARTPAPTPKPESEKPRSGSEMRRLSKEMAAVERKIAKTRDQLAAVEADMAAYATDMDQLVALGAQADGLKHQLDDLETRWLELGEQLEG